MCRDPYCRICNPPKEHYCYDNYYCPPQNNLAAEEAEVNNAVQRANLANRQELPPRPSFFDNNDDNFNLEAAS